MFTYLWLKKKSLLRRSEFVENYPSYCFKRLINFLRNLSKCYIREHSQSTSSMKGRRGFVKTDQRRQRGGTLNDDDVALLNAKTLDQNDFFGIS